MLSPCCSVRPPFKRINTGSEIAITIPEERHFLHSDFFQPISTDLSCTYCEEFYTTFSADSNLTQNHIMAMLVLEYMTVDDKARLPLFDGASAEYIAQVLPAIQEKLAFRDTSEESLLTKFHIMNCASKLGYLNHPELFIDTDVVLCKVSLIGMDLRGARLHNADLSEADLSGANLSNAVLSFAGLNKAKFNYAILTRANFTNAWLAQADFSHSEMSDVNLYQASMLFINLSDANLTRANLSKANLTGSNLVRANLHNAKLIEANLSVTDMLEADLTLSDLTDAIFSGADLRYSILTGATINGVFICWR